MNLEDYRTIFVTSSLILIMIATVPALSLIVSFPGGEKSFSELWILGPTNMAENYPLNVRANESFNVFVGMSNHMRVSSYYLIYAKFRNQTEPLPNVTASKPSPLTPFYEFRAFVSDGETWEAPFTFIISKVSNNNNSMFIDCLSVNDMVFVVNSSARWDSKLKGFYFQLVFELWLYNVSLQRFQFHDRYVGIWLNVTGF